MKTIKNFQKLQKICFNFVIEI